ncbi:MAG: hypothetical protein ACT4PP_05170 [Sporichthyaceae bacterium]
MSLGAVAVVGGATLLVPNANAVPPVVVGAIAYDATPKTVGANATLTVGLTTAAAGGTITGISVTPACGAFDATQCLPQGADPGVFTPATAVGTGAGCPGTAFTFTAVDPTTGAFGLVPNPATANPVVTVANPCSIAINGSIAKIPGKDIDAGTAGVQTRPTVKATATDGADTQNIAVVSATALTVTKNATTVTTTAEPTTAATGAQIRARATVAGEIPDGAGNLIFELFGPFVGPIMLADCNAFNRVFTSAVTPNAAASMLSAPTTVNNPGDYYWGTRFSGNANNDPSGQDCNATAAQKVAITGPAIPPLASPTIAGTATPSTAEVGTQVSDSATVTGRANAVAGGTITFRLFGPGDLTCTGTPVFTSTVPQPVANGPINSLTFTPTAVGEYRWTASYSGDAGNNPAATACGAAGQSLTVTPVASVSSFSCNGFTATHVLRAGDTNRTLTTGSGRQVIVIQGAGATVRSGSGPDVVCGGPGADNISTGSGDDFISGGGGADQINAGSGANTVV